MDVLACLKRVPNTGAKIVLTDDQQEIDTTNLGFTMSPHEECAVEEAVQITEDHGGSATALTLGPEDATEQVRTAIAMQADEGVLLETDGSEWSPRNVAAAIADFVRERQENGDGFDLLLFGNESADAGNYQVGVRVAEALGLPIVTSIKTLEVEGDTVIAEREISRGSEVYEIELPAVVAVKEGLNEPRYASMRARMQARRQSVETVTPERTTEPGLEKIRLEAPEEDEGRAEILGEGPEAVPEIMRVLEDELEVL
jgi:electron transfer flavoprotein beta subunit